MSLRSRVSCFPMLLATLLLSYFSATSTAAQQPTGAGKLSRGSASIRTELERAVDAGARVDSGWQATQLFRNKSSAKEARRTLGDDAATESAGFLLPPTSSNRFSRGTLEAHSGARVLGRRAPSQ